MGLTTNQKRALAVGGAVAIAVTAVFIFYQYKIHSTGYIVGVGATIYDDEQLINKVTEIDWGSISPTETKSFDCYILNTQDTRVTLSLTLENYIPPESINYITMTWNIPQDFILNPSESVHTTLYLTISANAQTKQQFSHEIVVTATKIE